MTVSFSPYDASLTVQFSQMVEFKLYPWFDEAFSAYAHLDYPVYGVSEPIQQLFPGYSSTADPSLRVFAASLDFFGPDHGVPRHVCVKLARGVDEVVRLSHEASIYRKELAKLGGIAVPKMYGYFIGHHEDAPVGCLMLELCPGPDAPIRSAELFIRRAMLSVRKVHTLGITQNAPLQLHHFVMKDEKVLLIDFAQAVVHRCNNAMPVYSNQRFSFNPDDLREEDERHNCGELITIAKESLRAAAIRC